MTAPVSTVTDSRIEKYRDWIAVAPFLLLTVDLLTTLAAARVVGPGTEGNSLMRRLLGRDVLVVVAHLVAVVFVTGCFRPVIDHLHRIEPLSTGISPS